MTGAPEESNPMDPTPLTFVVFALMLSPVALVVAAVVSIIRHRTVLSSTAIAVWVLVVLCFPVLGAIAWFLIGRPRDDLASLREG